MSFIHFITLPFILLEGIRDVRDFETRAYMPTFVKLITATWVHCYEYIHTMCSQSQEHRHVTDAMGKVHFMKDIIINLLIALNSIKLNFFYK